LRVRHRGDHASVEVSPDALARVEDQWEEIETRLLALGFNRVELDRRGYRRGGLLADLPVLGA
jgi:PP-loop superfamily ATP-utilizing enzyme